MSVFPAEHYATEIGTAEQWLRREPPLVPAAVLAVGDAVPELAAAAHARLAAGAELRAVADAGYLLVLGAEESLPWADGARYLGWDGRALTLTTHRVLPAAELWRDAAIAQEDADPGSLVAVLPDQMLISAMPVRAADPDLLRGLAGEAWTEPCEAGSDVRLPGPRDGGMAVRPPLECGPSWDVVAHMETQPGIAAPTGTATPNGMATRPGLDRRDTVVDEPA